MTINAGLDKLGESMPVKKYLYREEQEVFDKVEATKKKYAEQKFTTKDAITFLINAGYQADNEPVLDNKLLSGGLTNVALPQPTGTTISEVKT